MVRIPIPRANICAQISKTQLVESLRGVGVMNRMMGVNDLIEKKWGRSSWSEVLMADKWVFSQSPGCLQGATAFVIFRFTQVVLLYLYFSNIWSNIFNRLTVRP
ncbi:hypothetical protein PS2_023826 [Malus domestica]